MDLQFDEGQNGVVVQEDVHEVCLYEAMFKAGLRLPFPKVAQDVMSHLNLAPH